MGIRIVFHVKAVTTEVAAWTFMTVWTAVIVKAW